MHKGFLIIASVLGALSVILGALGAHALKKMVPAEAVSTFETGVRYQFYHVFALLAIGILYEKLPGKWLRYAGNCFLLGILLFSGSLYLLTFLQSPGKVGLGGIGIITPIGGLFFIAGWGCMLFGLLKRETTN